MVLYKLIYCLFITT